jgi:hypothetical protein
MTVGVRGPDFIVIGAQRSGTTWLYYVLRQHPELWLPPVKELHYFDRLKLGRGILRSRDWLPLIWTALKTRDPWVLRYFLRRRSDAWYARLFQDARESGLIAGEITPAYATLGEDGFYRILRINPKVKLIFIMRDPVERAWSAVHLDYRGGQIEGPLTEEKALERAREQGPVLRSSYIDTIDCLERIVPQRQLYFGFFDDLRDRPVAFVSHLLEFLGADASTVSGMNLPDAVNAAARGKSMPISFERSLAREYLPIVEQLCTKFEGPPHAWRERYRKLLSSAL